MSKTPETHKAQAPLSKQELEAENDRLRYQVERLEAALQGIRGGIWEMRLEPGESPDNLSLPDSVYLSPQLKAVIGFGDDELPNSLDAWKARILPDDRERFLALIRNNLQKGETPLLEATYRIRHRDGSVRWLTSRGKVFRDAQDRPVRRVGLDFDVTAHKSAYLTAQQREDQLRLLADSLPVLISYIDTEQRYQFDNVRHSEWFGTKKRLRGRRLKDVLGPKIYASIQSHLNAALSGRSVSYETTLPHSELGPRAVHVNYVPHVTEDGCVLGFYSLISDITETKRRNAEERGRQAEVSHAQRVATVGELATNLAHELNQPLGAITSYVGGLTRMLRHNLDREEAIGVLKKIAEQAQTAAEIVRSVRDFIGRSQRQHLPIDMNKVIEKCLNLTESRIEQMETEVETDTATRLPPVSGSAVQIEQVLINLITNALEAMEGRSPQRRRLVMESRHEGEYVLLAVKDSGQGIAADQLGRIFDPFHTTKHDGMGMGLSISRSIVEDHGGRLWAESKAGKGTTFYIRLPVYDDTFSRQREDGEEEGD